MTNRTYWHVPDARRPTWHAGSKPWQKSLCGLDRRGGDLDAASRLPPTAHLCGNCSRVIAATTDIEESTDMGDMGNAVAPI